MKSWIIAFAVTGLFLQPVLTLAAALPMNDFGTLAVFLALNGLLIFGLITGVAVLARMTFDRPRAGQSDPARSPQPHLFPQRQPANDLPIKRQDVC